MTTRSDILGLPKTGKFWLSYLPKPEKLLFDGKTITADYEPTTDVDCESVCEDTEDMDEYQDCFEECEETRKEHKTSINFDAETGKVLDAAVFIGCPYDEDGYLDEKQILKLQDAMSKAGFECITDRPAYVGGECLSAIHAHEMTSMTSRDWGDEPSDVCWFHVRSKKGGRSDEGTVADLAEVFELK